MCGIIGYVGKKKSALSFIVEGLKCLEYRGYDSAGIAYVDDENIKIVKSEGQISNLETKLNMNVESSIGIGHTRWATHGIPNEINSHPHRSGSITLVHNGIIENYMEIKDELGKEGKKFLSDTDSEVAACLIDSLFEKTKDMKEAILLFKKKVKGSYAIALMVDEDTSKIYVIKNLSPLIIGLGSDENFIASDVPAILKWTKQYVTLSDGEFAIVDDKNIDLYDIDGVEKEVLVKTFSGDASSIDKGEYEHFMLKEIHEEPEVIKTLISEYLMEDNLSSLPNLRNYKNVTIVACGSAYHAGLVGKHFIENNLDIPVSVELASEFKYKKLFINDEDVVIAISQSGETADTLAAVKIAKSLKAHTIGIVNVKESSIAREVDEVIYTLAGSEIAVATTKAYLSQIVLLLLISIQDMNLVEWKKELSSLPVKIEKLINEENLYKKIASEVKDRDDIFFIGRQIDYAICLEGSLKLKEISYIHSEAYAAGELKHGTISLISQDTPVFAVITDEIIAEKTISNIKEVKSRGARIFLVISEDIYIPEEVYDFVVVIPNALKSIVSIMSVIPLQMISYEVAKLRGCSIDKPRNLAKSVTVE
ncbi:MAG: glutamine--fructose-6-phosphate transaminase (isomerizing) [Bacilli bacterium]|nr:glutamine--fructose-6-phosphate transaminase (isomerizing) [Bacilli bacterium]